MTNFDRNWGGRDVPLYIHGDLRILVMIRNIANHNPAWLGVSVMNSKRTYHLQGETIRIILRYIFNCISVSISSSQCIASIQCIFPLCRCLTRCSIRNEERIQLQTFLMNVFFRFRHLTHDNARTIETVSKINHWY